MEQINGSTMVTEANLAQAKEDLPCDLRDEAIPGAQYWSIKYGPGQYQIGCMMVLPCGRGALFTGGNSVWGDWNGSELVLQVDDGSKCHVAIDGTETIIWPND